MLIYKAKPRQENEIKIIRLVRGIDDFVSSQSIGQLAAAARRCNRSSDALPSRLLEASLGYHIDLVWQGDDQVFI